VVGASPILSAKFTNGDCRGRLPKQFGKLWCPKGQWFDAIILLQIMNINPCSKCKGIYLSIKQTKLLDYYVVCFNCSKAIICNSDTEEEAIEAWNKKNPWRIVSKVLDESRKLDQPKG
jgi:hypothetical protein